MKKITFALLFSFITFSISAEEIEFDGLYIKTQSGENIELTEQNGEIVKYYFDDEPHKRRLDTNWGLMLRECHCVQIKADDFKGLTFQGSEKDRDDISFHVVRKRAHTEEDWYVRDKGYLKQGEEVFIVRNQSNSSHLPDVRKKMISEHQLYIQPREKLQKGFYAGWLTKRTAWIFEII